MPFRTAEAITTLVVGAMGVRPIRTNSVRMAQISAPPASKSPGRANDARLSCTPKSGSASATGEIAPSVIASNSSPALQDLRHGMDIPDGSLHLHPALPLSNALWRK